LCSPNRYGVCERALLLGGVCKRWREARARELLPARATDAFVASSASDLRRGDRPPGPPQGPMAMPLLSRCGGCGAFARAMGCSGAWTRVCRAVTGLLSRACLCLCLFIPAGEGDRIYPMSIVESGTWQALSDTGVPLGRNRLSAFLLFFASRPCPWGRLENVLDGETVELHIG
jgi:hypothetical protein